MKNRIKIILYYLLEFILSILIFCLVSLILLKTTLYNPSYVKKQFINNNYYTNLSKSINEEMSNYIIQSGLTEDVIKNIYTEEILKETIENIIESTYKGKKVIIDTKKIENNLKANINDYLEKNNIEVKDQESLDKFIEQILNVYKDEVSLSNSIKYAEKIISKTKHLVTFGSILCIILIILTIIIIKKITKEKILTIPLFTTSLLFLFSILYINNSIIIDNIYIWDDNVSNLLHSIIYNIINKIKLYGIILFIIGCLDIIINKKIIKKLKRKLNK